MSRSVIFYISGHGYGHGVRTAQVIAASAQLHPTTPIHIRTTAPQWLFAASRAAYSPVHIDSGIVESEDALHIDGPATVARLQAFLAAREPVVAAEAAFLRAHNASLIVSDIPFLAGEIAARAAIPCIGISNFTWNWIFAPLLDQAGDQVTLPIIEAAYAHMTELWIPGFPQPTHLEPFRAVRHVPAIVRQRHLDPSDVRARLGIPRDQHRAIVFIASRGKLSAAAVHTAAAASPEYLFLTGDPSLAMPANVRAVEFTPELNFSEVLGIADVVLSKLGYGTLVECIAAGKRLLYPPRFGFAEDALTEAEAPRFLNMQPLPLPDYHSGNWAPHLATLLTQPTPPQTMDCTGATYCAAHLSH